MDESYLFLIEQKTSFIGLTCDLSMSWWVSSVVFCGSIFGATWIKRRELSRDRAVVKILGGMLFAFFSSVVIFGLLISFYFTRSLDEQLRTLLPIIHLNEDALAVEMNTMF